MLGYRTARLDPHAPGGRPRWLRTLLFAATAATLVCLPLSHGQRTGWHWTAAHAQDEGEAPDDMPTDVPPDDAAVADALQPGEAVVTRFSGLADATDAKGKPVKVIDTNGTVASFIDLAALPEPPFGQHWIDEPQRLFVTAGEVGQVFGVTIADRGDGAPDIFLSATAAFGLHHEPGTGPRDWMAGMWGPDGGPGTIWKLSAANGYRAEKFVDVTLDGRPNSGAALGNLAYDKLHDLVFASDLETGMIHAFEATTGQERATWDHGVDGRSNFLDVATGEQLTLDPVAFDPASGFGGETCAGNPDRTPSCWNIADFRRRVWGLNVRAMADGTARLFYSVWGSDGLANPDWEQGGDDRFNAVWSVAILEDGTLDSESVRREFLMPAFWPVEAKPDKAELSNPVSDITFPQCDEPNIMLVAERGGMRNLGLAAREPFSRPHESRVIRYEVGEDESWSPTGRYDTGFLNHDVVLGAPSIFANTAGGVDFGFALEASATQEGGQAQSVWMTGDSLCSPKGRCADKQKGADADASQVHGLQGMPLDALSSVEPSPGTDMLYRSVMIDTDINVDENGNAIEAEMTRDDATKIGDVAIYQACAAEPEQPADIISPPDDWPVHTLAMSHQKWASAGHRAARSWHWREGSWHTANRSWHWREGSWHTANRSWHWRKGSWHTANRSWHWRQGSWHTANRSWHWRQGSWHNLNRSWHLKPRSWHNRNRSWDNGHFKARSWHNRARSWDNGHLKARSWHLKGRSWKNDKPIHFKARSWHAKGRSWKDHVKPVHNKRLSNDKVHVKPIHNRRLSNNNDHVKPIHNKRLSNQNKPVHNKRLSNGKDHVKPVHSRRLSNQNKPVHSKRLSNKAGHHNDPVHGRRLSNQQNHQPVHSKRKSRGDQHVDKPRHSKRLSNGQNQSQQVHKRKQSRAGQDQGHTHNEGKPARKHRKKLSQMGG